MSTRPVKNRWLGARVDERLETRVIDYIAAAELTMGELVRMAVEEYMSNHPAKQPVPPLADALKPGSK